MKCIWYVDTVLVYFEFYIHVWLNAKGYNIMILYCIVIIEKQGKLKNTWAGRKMGGYCKSTLKSNRRW